MLSIYMSNGKNHYLIKQIMKLMNCDFKSLYVYMFSLFKGKSGDFWFFFLTLRCIQFCVVRDTWIMLPAYSFLCIYSKWVLHGN